MKGFFRNLFNTDNDEKNEQTRKDDALSIDELIEFDIFDDED